jgi:hypothetical protein
MFQPNADLLTVTEMTIRGIVISPHSADPAWPLSRREVPGLPVAPLDRRIALCPLNSVIYCGLCDPPLNPLAGGQLFHGA